MDHKGYRHIPRALFDAITFLAQALPKRSVPTFLELLFGAIPRQGSLPMLTWPSIPLGTGTATTSGYTSESGHGLPWDARQLVLRYRCSRAAAGF